MNSSRMSDAGEEYVAGGRIPDLYLRVYSISVLLSLVLISGCVSAYIIRNGIQNHCCSSAAPSATGDSFSAARE